MGSRVLLSIRRWLRLALAVGLFGFLLFILVSQVTAGAGASAHTPGGLALTPAEPFYARANTAFDTVDGYFGYPVTVQYTVTNGKGELKGTGQGATEAPAGWLSGVGCNCDIAPGDRVEVRSSAGFRATLEPIPIEGTFEINADRLTGKMYKASFPAKGGARVWSDASDQSSAFHQIDIAADGSYSLDVSGEFDIQLGDQAAVWYYDANGNWVGTILSTSRLEAEIWFDPKAHSNMWGHTEPGAALTVTTAYAQVHTVAGDDRSWNAPDVGPLQAGDMITIEVAGLPLVLMPVAKPWDVQADSATNKVWGQVGGRSNKTVEVHGQWDGGYQEVTTDATGHFTATYGDVPRGAQGYIRWVDDLASYAQAVYHQPFQTADLTIRVDYYHDDLYGYYPAGHTVAVTVTNCSAVTKATAAATTGPLPWDANQIGFSVQPGDWQPGRPNLGPGDCVDVSADDGAGASVRIGTLTGQVDAATNSVGGHVYASWFTQTLDIACHPWNGAPSNAPAKDSTAGPNGDPPFHCQWDPATEWKIVPGQVVGVWYIGPDANWVGNGFGEPAPNLSVQTWSAGDGEAAAGGRAVFQVMYLNRGDVEGSALLTDTLPAGATYVADSSGFPAVVSGDKVVWDLGVVSPMTMPHQFQVVVRPSPAASGTLRNIIDIAAPYDTDWGDNHAEADVKVGDGMPDLHVNANVSPGDPSPGELFHYGIEFGNDGPVASGRACLTETLPLSTTFVSLEQSQNYQLWKPQSSSGRQLVYCAPSVPGRWGTEILLNLRLDPDVPYGTQLINQVEIGTPGDTNLDNNIHTNDAATAEPLRYEPAVEKWSWGSETLAAGGEADFGLRYQNRGNAQAHDVAMTDTLPAGVTFIAAEIDAGWGIRIPFPPSHIAGNQLTWDLGNLEVNTSQSFVVRLRINSDTAPGSVLKNCVQLRASDDDENPYNNDECVSETVQPAGRNLRVLTFPSWVGQNRLRFDVRADNIGTATVPNVVFTDTFPAGLALNNWDVDWGQGWQWDLTGNQLTVTFDRMEPASTSWIHLVLDAPDVPNGTQYTNTAAITVPPGDPNPADNRETVVVGTGPDLSIEKWQSGGPMRPEPNDVFTYTLHLENHSPAWGTQGDVCVTDTLPAGVEFVELLRRRCWPDFCHETVQVSGDGVLSWCISPWADGSWDDLFLAVRLRDTVRPGAVLVNRATIFSDNAADVEPDYSDNSSSAAVTAQGASSYLPMILRGDPSHPMRGP